ncbi:cytochrome C [Neobacillus sp. PS3-34]|uniref:cytochrome C n=1 Tax=Neobacillus sp. PS3-34 TaxID=3070678 RepID=UPI0027E153E1|nr:cytochrome C [Neobacillus sp. PS3-34]WML50444.1 cytochrome C [Neobacillus sp. PS3-34]
MKNAIISFVISAFVGLGIGYVVFQVLGDTGKQPQASESTEKSTDAKEAASTPAETSKEENKTVSVNADILTKKGCLGCHSIGSLNIKGGAVGPDLSQAFVNVEGKHGKPIEEFLKQPTSAVMSGVIGKNPLTDDERKQVLDLLKQASEAK